MANMSYCRFHNTSADLAECLDALRERETLSDSEKRKAHQMLSDILGFFCDEGIIDEYTWETCDLWENLDKFFDSIETD